jgi:MOSC domain-containing protein YiiM
MTEVQQASVLAGRGIDAENRKPGKREITLLSAEAWAQACSELGAVLPWFMRRANLLVEGIELSQTIGLRLRIGPVQLHVHGETKPCKIMDEQHEGLREALEPYCRGGVFGQILVGGTIHVGDTVRLEAP